MILNSTDKFLFTFEGSLSGISIERLTILMFGSLLILLFLGLPLAFVTGGLGVIFIYVVGNQLMLNLIPTRIFSLNDQLPVIGDTVIYFYGLDAGASGINR